MTATTTRATEPDRGVIAGRELIAVQTIDVARLTTHVVPILPGTFIAVSGIGPKNDSNGSGKTSFLAAVTVLLADPQWRLDTDGGLSASGLLFKPEAAGVEEGQYAAATHGYIIGVFADPDRPGPDSSITVWVRLGQSSPYLQVRTAEGIVLADADTEEQRYAQADALWASLKRDSQFSARKMSQALYGDAPRCMAYLDTTLRKASPSLLSQQMTEMSPTAIGQSLIDLAGLREQFEAEQSQRSTLAEQERKLVETRRDNVDRTRVEDAELAAVRARAKAREELTYGALLWRLHFAKRYVAIVPEHAKATERLADAQENVQFAMAELTKKQKALDEAKRPTDESKRLEQARTAYETARDHLAGLDSRYSSLNGQIGVHISNRTALKRSAEGWDGTSVEDATTAVTAAQKTLAAASAEEAAAERAVRIAERDLASARLGQTPSTVAALDALTTAGIPAVALADTVSLADDARAYWEPVLWSWRDAVVIAPEHAIVAAEATTPGTLLVAADAPLDAGTSADGPAGVITGVPLAAFLTAAADRYTNRTTPDRVVDEHAGATIVGGFQSPTTGRDARIAAAQAVLDDAAMLHSGATKAVARAARTVEAAKAVLEVASVNARLAELETTITTIETQIAEVQTQQPAARADEQATMAALIEATNQVSGRETRILRAQTDVTEAQRALTDAETDRNGAQAYLDSLHVTYWAEGWGDTVQAAQALLNAQDTKVQSWKPSTMRRYASEALLRAVEEYRTTVDVLPTDVESVDEQREQLVDEDEETQGVPSFADVAQPLQLRLDGQRERDQIIVQSIEHDRAVRAQTEEALEAEVNAQTGSLQTLQHMIERHVADHFDRMSEALNRLDLARGGFGARLDHRSRLPESPTGTWQWEVSPQWRRAAGGKMINYREVANGAQVKVFAVQVTLAALLAADATARAGQVLVIDELGNSLGDQNRKDVLGALRSVAEGQRVTILGTCQDSVLYDAADACKSLLWFTHASTYDAYNQPVKVWAYDDDADRVEMTADWVRSGRPWL